MASSTVNRSLPRRIATSLQGISRITTKTQSRAYPPVPVPPMMWNQSHGRGISDRPSLVIIRYISSRNIVSSLKTLIPSPSKGRCGLAGRLSVRRPKDIPRDKIRCPVFSGLFDMVEGSSGLWSKAKARQGGRADRNAVPVRRRLSSVTSSAFRGTDEVSAPRFTKSGGSHTCAL
jgi:hypothetical protein